MKIVYGTNNSAKFNLMKKAFEGTDIELCSLKDFDIDFPEIIEDGKTPLENAYKKAKGYYDILKMPVFSCDSGLYIDNIPDELQPGLFVRRVNGKTLSDKEAQEYYMNLAKKYGDLICRYKNGVAFVYDDKNIFSSMDDSLSTEKFIMTSIPHPHIHMKDGFPLDSLSIDIKTGKYYYDIPNHDLGADDMIVGYKQFFLNCLNSIK